MGCISSKQVSSDEITANASNANPHDYPPLTNIPVLPSQGSLNRKRRHNVAQASPPDINTAKPSVTDEHERQHIHHARPSSEDLRAHYSELETPKQGLTPQATPLPNSSPQSVTSSQLTSLGATPSPPQRSQVDTAHDLTPAPHPGIGNRTETPASASSIYSSDNVTPTLQTTIRPVGYQGDVFPIRPRYGNTSGSNNGSGINDDRRVNPFSTNRASSSSAAAGTGVMIGDDEEDRRYGVPRGGYGDSALAGPRYGGEGGHYSGHRRDSDLGEGDGGHARAPLK